MTFSSGIDFEFADCDSLLVELEEQYSYAEVDDFKLNRLAAESLSKEIGHEIGSELFCRRALANLEILNNETKLNSIRSLMCVLQGGSHISSSEVDQAQPEEGKKRSKEEQEEMNAELIHGIRVGCYELVKLEGWGVLFNLLIAESKTIKKDVTNQKFRQVLCRLLYSICYTVLEIVRREPAPSDPSDWWRIHRNFKDELADHSEYIAELMDLLVDAQNVTTSPLLPLKKMSLLIWKLALTIFGGFDNALTIKNKKRISHGLEPIPNAMETVNKLTPVIAPIDVMSLNDDDNVRQKPKLRRDIQKYEEEGSDSMLGEDTSDEGIVEDRPATPMAGSLGRGTPRPSLTSSRPNSPDSDARHINEQINWSFPHLPWAPKVTPREMNEYISAARVKYLDYSFKHSDSEIELNIINNNRFGLPRPIQNSLTVMDKYIYISLADRERNKWQEHEDHPLTKQFNPDQTPVEQFYKIIYKKIPVYVISMLKLLLSAAPTSNKGEILQHDQAQQNLQIEPMPDDQKYFKLPAMLIGIDVSRHKEIATKAISGLLLLILKHLKSNHIYQFEYFCHHLYASNCVPLIIKIFNQQMTSYISQRNQIPLLDFRMAVRGLPIIQAQLEKIEESEMPFCWRNLFSSICFLRILMKIVKHKPWRAMSLVVFKSTPIFKRAMIVKHGMFQLYLLKVIKVHARYLGRPWRKTNMGIVSAIYSMVRHHLTDDWAFANETEKRPWEYRGCENDLKGKCVTYNKIYSNEDNEWVSTALNTDDSEIKLPHQFDKNYESWIEQEVLAVSVDWNQLMMPVNDILLEKSS